jgi:hypothetical protein
MLQVNVTSPTTGRSRTYDLHLLAVGGTYAHYLRGPDLYHELTLLNVPGILPTDGWQQLAIKLAQWRDETPAGRRNRS